MDTIRPLRILWRDDHLVVADKPAGLAVHRGWAPLGGPRVSLPELLDFTTDSLSAGTSGVIYGRNVWQRDNCAEVSAALVGIVHGSKAAV